MAISSPAMARDARPLPASLSPPGREAPSFMPSCRHQLFQQAEAHLSPMCRLWTPGDQVRISKGSSHPQFSQESSANICIRRQTAESPQLMCWFHHKVILVCMRCMGIRTTPPAPAFIIHSSKLNSAHSRSMTSAWVMLNLMEKKELKLEDLGEESLLVVLKSRTHFLCYFYIPSCSLSLRSLVPNKSLRGGAAIRRYHRTATQPEASSCHSSGAPVDRPPCTQGIMPMQLREDKCKLRNAHFLPSPTLPLYNAITRGTQISVPWNCQLSNRKSTVSPPGRDSIWILEHFKALGRINKFTLPILNSRKMDPLDISVCALLSLSPPPQSPNDHHACHSSPRTPINAGHCHWPGLQEGTRASKDNAAHHWICSQRNITNAKHC